MDDFEFEEAAPAEAAGEDTDDFGAAEASQEEPQHHPPVDQVNTPAPTASPVAQVQHVDSSATTAFKQANAKAIAQREAEQNAKKKAMAQKAEAYLEKFKQERAKRIKDTASANRAAQAKQAAGAPLTVGGLVDLEKATTDREKMRALLKSV